LEYQHLKEMKSSLGRELEGKKVALCVTGSVSCFKSVEIARLLIRHGADVRPVMSQAATKLVTPALLTWATGNDAVTQLTGAVEHVWLAGENKERVDLVLIAPCTANTLGKLAYGIDDTPVTSLASVALGSHIPIVVAPAMHEPMYSNPVVLENIERLKGVGVVFVEPRLEEGKAKLASAEDILFVVASLIGKKQLKGRRVLVTAGPTREFIDPIRLITNPSSGKMGFALAAEAKLMGANVTLVTGPTQLLPPPVDKVFKVVTTEEMLEKVFWVMQSSEVDLAIFAAAPSDYRPAKTSSLKINSRARPRLSLKLVLNPKIVAEVKKKFPSAVIVAFKAEYGLTKEGLVAAAKQLKANSGADVVVANDASVVNTAFESDTNQGLILGFRDEIVEIPFSSKRSFASNVLDYLGTNLGHP
jgi:phosphopantothenoylcysteine decarboxylase/phosphopantothenate--cysteine ligase